MAKRLQHALVQLVLVSHVCCGDAGASPPHQAFFSDALRVDNDDACATLQAVFSARKTLLKTGDAYRNLQQSEAFLVCEGDAAHLKLRNCLSAPWSPGCTASVAQARSDAAALVATPAFAALLQEDEFSRFERAYESLVEAHCVGSTLHLADRADAAYLKGERARGFDVIDALFFR